MAAFSIDNSLRFSFIAVVAVGGKQETENKEREFFLVRLF